VSKVCRADGSAGEREEVRWKDGRWEKGRLPMGAVLPAAPAVAIQTLKIEKDGARECIICCDNIEVGEEATPLPCNY
jgi:hypothetical protein